MIKGLKNDVDALKIDWCLSNTEYSRHLAIEDVISIDHRAMGLSNDSQYVSLFPIIHHLSYEIQPFFTFRLFHVQARVKQEIDSTVRWWVSNSTHLTPSLPSDAPPLCLMCTIHISLSFIFAPSSDPFPLDYTSKAFQSNPHGSWSCAGNNSACSLAYPWHRHLRRRRQGGVGSFPKDHLLPCRKKNTALV